MFRNFFEFQEGAEKTQVLINTRGNKKNLPFGKNPSMSKRLRSYTASVWTFICVRFLANSMVAIPWGFEVDGEEVDSTHPAVELFTFVNEEETFSQLIKGLVSDFKNVGWSILVPQIEAGRVIRMKRAEASSITFNTSSDVIISIFWNVNSRQIELPWGSFVLFKDYASLHPLKWDSPGSVTFDKAKIDQGFDANLNSFLENYSVPPWVFTSKQNVSDRDITRYSNMWNSIWSNLKNRFKAQFMGGGLTPTRLTSALKDMVFPELKQENRLEICAAFGVLPSLVGAVTQVNRSDRIEQVKMVYHTTIIPDAIYFAETINNFFQPFMFENAKFVFYPERVELLQEERTAKSERIIQEVQMGLLNIESASKRLGYLPEELGSMIDRRILLDPQSSFQQSFSTKRNEKADWQKFEYKFKRYYNDDILSDFDFESDIIDRELLAETISFLKDKYEN